MRTPTQRPQNAITEGVIWKQLLTFFFPILLGTFFQQLYNTADAIVVGKFVGKEALAAVGATATLANLLVGFFVGLSSGATVIISQHYGARRYDEVSHTVHTAAALTLAGGVVIMVLGLVFSPTVLRWMDTPEDVLPGAVTYLCIYFLGMVPSLVYNIGTGVLRAVGDSRRPLYFLICACVTNILLDVLFVAGFEWGVAGAAFATILSQLVSGVLIVLSLLKTHDAYRLEPKRIRFHGDLLSRIVRIGFPADMQSVMYSLSNLIIQAAINGFGTDVVAAWTAYGKMDGVFWMTIQAFGVAITTFVGQNFGAGWYDRMRRSVKVCFGMAAVATVSLSGVLLLLGGVLLLLGGVLLRLFTGDDAVVEHGLKIIHTLVPLYFTYITIEILSGAVRGTGDTLIPTLMTLTGVCLLRVLWISFVVPKYHQLEMVLYSYPITWVITSVMYVVYYFRGKWLERGLRLRGENGEGEQTA